MESRTQGPRGQHRAWVQHEQHNDKEEGMNKSRLIWGILCLALAGLLAVLNFVLPPDSLIFMVGNSNLPFLPAAILGIVGLVLLAV